MSKFTTKPYIESVLAELSGENKAKLLNLVNGKSADGLSDISYIKCKTVSAIASLDSGVSPVAYSYTPTIIWKGYFIKTTNYSCFVTFKNGIDLNVASVYKVTSSNLVAEEFCAANTLRALLREDSYIDVPELSENNKNAAIVIETSDITGLTKEQLDSLKPGDIVNKKTGNMLHSYHVSYKGEGAGQGICLTYSAAGYIETVSYDRSGSNWVYNSTDVTDVTKTGTKLYHHDIDLSDGSSLFVISNQHDTYDVSKLYQEYCSGLLTGITFYDDIESQFVGVLALYKASNSELTIYYFSTVDETILYRDLSINADTVTEL